MSAYRVIVRYKNRNLYDTLQGKQISLKELLYLYRTEHLKVEDIVKRDITAATVFSSIVEHMRRDPNAYNEALIALIAFAEKGVPLSEIEYE